MAAVPIYTSNGTSIVYASNGTSIVYCTLLESFGDARITTVPAITRTTLVPADSFPVTR